MLDAITKALNARRDLQDWSLRHITTRDSQLYAVPTTVESRRSVVNERYIVNVLRQNQGADGALTCGSSNATLLPGDNIDAALDIAALMAGMVHNSPYSLPGPTDFPEVPLVDATLQKDAAATLDGLFARLQAAAKGYPEVHLNAAEAAGQEQTTHLLNSKGIDVSQTDTLLTIEWVFKSQKQDRESESFVELERRRVADLDIEGEVARQAQYTADLLNVSAPPDHEGAVVLQGGALTSFLAAGLFESGVIHNLASAAAKYAKVSTWEIGKSVFRGEVTGDPLNVWANRQLAYGLHSNRFDEEGIPARRVEIIRDNKLVAFSASQRYSEYLSIPATGSFGNIELAAGKTPAAALLAEPHVEVAGFSWFNPDPVTGDFASEIRLGYVVDGNKRTPFKGGMLVGNVIDALANVRWSVETVLMGDYLGPKAARFAALKVVGNG